VSVLTERSPNISLKEDWALGKIRKKNSIVEGVDLKDKVKRNTLLKEMGEFSDSKEGVPNKKASGDQVGS